MRDERWQHLSLILHPSSMILHPQSVACNLPLPSNAQTADYRRRTECLAIPWKRCWRGPRLQVVSGYCRKGIEAVRPRTGRRDLGCPPAGHVGAGSVPEHPLDLDARVPVIVITAHGTTETAIEAMKLGAFEYLLKPLDLVQLRDVVGPARSTPAT